ncbi:glycosyltransferase [Vibrio kanaloae]|uniref:glycosyltransferase n=1 Tax=Vibrio kanaloae TaxID=170673 RepID=UPI00148CDA84|nr:glycosyltransferase [Vibrio kanaloae]
MIALPSLGGGGAEKNVVMIANYLANIADVHIVCCYSNDGNKNLASVDRRVKVTFLGKKKIITSLPKLVSFIYDYKPGTIITTVAYFSLLFSLVIPLLPKKIKFICRETNIPDVYGKQKSLAYRFLSSLIYRLFYRNYDTIICQSNDMLNSIKRITKISEDKLVKINNPALIYKCENKSLESPIQCANGYLLAAGRLTYQKGFDLLIEEYMYSEFFTANIPLFIAGTGPDYEKLQLVIDRLGLSKKIVLLGFRDDITTLIYNARAFILSSRYEGFPNVVLESLTLGCPVIARNCPGGLTEIIRESVNGFLYEDNFDDVSRKFMLENFDRDIIKHDVVERFNQDALLSKYLELV